MKCEITWQSRKSGDFLQTFGLLLKSDRLIHFYPVRGRESYARVFNIELEESLSQMSPEDVFNYYTGSGNGVTSDWSEKEVHEGTDEEEVAANAMHEFYNSPAGM